MISHVWNLVWLVKTFCGGPWDGLTEVTCDVRAWGQEWWGQPSHVLWEWPLENSILWSRNEVPESKRKKGEMGKIQVKFISLSVKKNYINLLGKPSKCCGFDFRNGTWQCNWKWHNRLMLFWHFFLGANHMALTTSHLKPEGAMSCSTCNLILLLPSIFSTWCGMWCSNNSEVFFLFCFNIIVIFWETFKINKL